MTLTFCRDLSAAEWITGSDLPWERLVSFGPAGFESYARLRFLPDPARRGQSETDVVGQDSRAGQLPRLFGVLATHTATPHDCYFCVWEGFGMYDAHGVVFADDAVYIVDDIDTASHARADPDARPAVAPEPAGGRRAVAHLPRVVVPHRAYWLFRGPLAEVGTWNTAQGWPALGRLDETEPAFVWPADHAWCVARDVDPHWAGIGAHPTLITQLTTDQRLDVISADPTKAQPLYR